MIQYTQLLNHILTTGVYKDDRTNTGTLSTFGYQMRFDLNEGFPLVTTKKIHLKSVIHELLWFLNGDTNIKYLNDNGVKIWNEWADSNGDLGKIYSYQWRSWNSNNKVVDQISELIYNLQTNPNSRRHIITAWNPSDLDEMNLPPCHVLFQFYVINNKLSCQLYQRSGDVFLGIPFNIASYSLLTMMIAQVTGLDLGEFIHVIGDAHIYTNHIEQVKLQLSRDLYRLPTMSINKDVDNIFQFKYEDFTLEKYKCHPHIKGEVAV